MRNSTSERRIRAKPLLWVLAATAAAYVSVVPRPARGDEERPASRWEDAIRAFESADRGSPPPKHAVLFVGSSSIRMWDLAKGFPRRRVINRGFGGSQIADSTEFAARIIIPHAPRVVVLYAGDNDIAGGKSAEIVARDFDLDAIRGKLHSGEVVDDPRSRDRRGY